MIDYKFSFTEIGYWYGKLENTAAAAGTCILLITIFSSWSPVDLRPTTNIGVGWEHVAAFGALGGCWGLAFPRRACQLLFILALTAIILEAGQFVVPGRHARLIDVATKIAGGASGILIALAIRKLAPDPSSQFSLSPQLARFIRGPRKVLSPFLSICSTQVLRGSRTARMVTPSAAPSVVLTPASKWTPWRRPRFSANTLQIVDRDLRQESLPTTLPGRPAATARAKLIRLSEEVVCRTPLGSRLGRPYRGKGLAVMLHEVHHNVDEELRTGCNTTQIERVIGALRATGRDIVTPDEGLRRLADPDTKPFALVTFDDAYRDNLTNALPLFERLSVPMTIFVPTGMITRELYAWWLGIRHWISKSDVVDIMPMGRRFACSNLASKLSALRHITSWIGDDQARADSLAPLFRAQGIEISALVERYAMDETELCRIAAHPLVTIGGHTETHRFLSGLSEAEVRSEFLGNKAWLEALLDRRISYSAYPFGTPGSSGEREARLAAEAGFNASFTTRSGQLFPEHLEHPQLLPRIDVGYAPQSRAALASRLIGLNRAISTRFGNPIATLN